VSICCICQNVRDGGGRLVARGVAMSVPRATDLRLHGSAGHETGLVCLSVALPADSQAMPTSASYFRRKPHERAMYDLLGIVALEAHDHRNGCAMRLGRRQFSAAPRIFL